MKFVFESFFNGAKTSKKIVSFLALWSVCDNYIPSAVNYIPRVVMTLFFQSFKEGVISEGIFNLVPSSKKENLGFKIGGQCFGWFFLKTKPSWVELIFMVPFF